MWVRGQASVVEHWWATPGSFLVGEENSRVWLTKIIRELSLRQFVPRDGLPTKKAFLGFDAVCGSEQWVEGVGGLERSKTRAGHGNL